MNEAIGVEARFNAGGQIRPLAFIWRGRRYRILSLGRQWDEKGERLFLVMTTGKKIFEIAYLPAEGAWRLRNTPEHFLGQRSMT